MKVSPKVSLLSTNEDTENNQDVYDVYLALKLNYFNRMFELSKMEMHNDLEFVHHFSIYILKEDDKYRVFTCRSHIHEVYKGGVHFGDAFIINENKKAETARKNLSVYETVEMDKEYTTLNIKEIVSDFNNIFKDVEKEKLSLELIVF